MPAAALPQPGSGQPRPQFCSPPTIWTLRALGSSGKPKEMPIPANTLPLGLVAKDRVAVGSQTTLRRATAHPGEFSREPDEKPPAANHRGLRGWRHQAT